MRRLAFALVLTIAACGAHAQEPPAWFAQSFLDIREDAVEAAKQGKRLMVYFHQDGCPYCKQLVEVTFRDARVVEKVRRHFVAIDINIYGAREVTAPDGRTMPEKEFTKLLGIRGTPTLVFFDAKAQAAHRISGYLPPDKFLRALDAAR